MYSHNIRLIATDLDGTALDEEGNLDDFTLQAFAHAASLGISIAAATGRALCALPPSVASCPHIQYALTSNGAAIYRLKDRSCLYRHPLSQENLQALLALIRRYHVPAEVFINGEAFADEAFVYDPASYGLPQRSVTYVRTTRRPCPDIPALISKHITEVEALDIVLMDMELKQEIRRQAEAIPDLYVTSSVPHYLEFASGGTHKEAALAYLASLLNIGSQEVLAFGDGENDKEMLAYAGIGVAMGNASEELKAQADYIAPSNREQGVARTIYHLMGPGRPVQKLS